MDDSRALEERDVEIKVDEARLAGTLHVPAGAQGLVLFVHGSGSSRFSSRNRFVARVLQDARLGTLLFDLLSAEEERIDRYTAELRFDIGLLTDRVIEVTAWLRADEETRDLKIGYFGASTGAAAALAAAARLGNIDAVVSRGGRPDLADAVLPEVKAPTLLVVGGEDTAVISLNRQALARLQTAKELKIIPGATHLFEEPGALEQVAGLAKTWFLRYLSGRPVG